jgi:hypothetical protein
MFPTCIKNRSFLSALTEQIFTKQMQMGAAILANGIALLELLTKQAHSTER